MRGKQATFSQNSPHSRPRLGEALLIATLLLAAAQCGAREKSNMAHLEVIVTEANGARSLPCRVHLSSGGRAVYAPDCPRWERDGEFCCEGRFSTDLPAGKIKLLVERGPEWRPHSEEFKIEPGGSRTLRIGLSRRIDMNKRGWYSGDLHVHRPPTDMPLLMCGRSNRPRKRCASPTQARSTSPWAEKNGTTPRRRGSLSDEWTS